MCTDDLLCPECEVANKSKLAELQTKTKHATAATVQEPVALVAEPTNRPCSSNSKVNKQKKNKLSSDNTDMDLLSGVSDGSAAVAAAAVNSDVETSSHQPNKQLSSCAAVSIITSISTDISTEHQLASLRAEVHR